VLVKIDAARAKEADKKVWEDLDILHKAFDLRFRRQDFGLRHEVPFYNASEEVFQGLRVLLDDQVIPERRQAALVRLRKYAGVEPGYTPFTELLRQRELEQIAKPGVIYPSKGELDTELGRNSNEVERFTYRAPGQANSYFYGYTRLLSLRKETEKALGKKFDQKKFHDFILAQGLLPPDLMRKAVLEEFVPASR
jgi:Bacterial protein of unknown function (DUF885)